MKSIQILLAVFIVILSSCKNTQNTDENNLLGTWLKIDDSKDSIIWKFSNDNIVTWYSDDENLGSFYYSIIEKCPVECERYKSKWEIEKYLFLKSVKDTSRYKCYEIIFEENDDLSLRYLPLERDTYDIFRRINK